ncbi:MAG: toll/interleukin-1 receptor domain-containing protein [Vicinamibacterales bacterium]
MPGGSIFISYRRDDAAGEAGRLSDHLARRFGPHTVFMDIDTIVPGTDFVVELDRALSSTAVVIVVIGRKWLSVTNLDGSRRIDDSTDFVRREIQTALQRGSRVIPLLVQGAAMPSAADLPAELAQLATRQASAIQHEEFSADAQRLADAIAPLIEGSRPWWGTGRGRALIGGALATVVLGLAGWQWFGWVATSERRFAGQASGDAKPQHAQQQQVDDLITVAAGQLQRRQFADALATLDRAVAMDADVARARALQEDVAMQSIRELSLSDGETFTDAMKKPLTVLDRATPFATGQRQADLLSHLGWATFLRRRDGDRRIDPEDMYRRAIAADRMNPFANAMLGHWVLWSDGGETTLERARPFFRVAADAGRATDVVRHLQLSALRNHQTAPCQLEAIRVLDEMRRRGEALRPGDANSVWSTYYFALADRGDLDTSALIAVLPPADHLLTLQWAFEGLTQDGGSRRQQFRYYTARLQAAAGRTAEARESLRTLSAELGTARGGSLPDAVAKALKDLGPAIRR